MRVLILTVLLLGAQVGLAAECAVGTNPADCKGCDTVEDVCDTCATGYYILQPDKSLDCTKCPDGCPTCSMDTAGASPVLKCDTCDTGYYKDSAGMCQKCDKACTTCTAAGASGCTGSTSCADRHYYDNVDSTCKECHAACKTCTGPGDTGCTSASACSDYYYHDGSKCTPCNPLCKACSGTGTDDSVCTTCADGYYRSSTSSDDPICIQCLAVPDDNCIDCGTNDAECDECKPNYVPNTDKDACLRCNSDNCDVCGVNQVCTTCKDGYELKSDKSCGACDDIPGCASCSPTAAGCQTCKTGYLKLGGECKGLEDAIGCEVFSTNTGCKECKADHYTGTDTYKCEPCMAGCVECEDEYVCDRCNTATHWMIGTRCVAKGTPTCPEGTYPDSDDVCQECPDGCKVCTAENACGTCYDEYAAPGCTTVSTGCPTGEFGTTGNCEECHDTCKRCTAAAENACTHCRLGRFLGTTGNDAGKCVACKDGSNCGSCIDADDCTSCPAGYSFNDDGTACETTGSGFGGYVFSGAAVLISLLTLL